MLLKNPNRILAFITGGENNIGAPKMRNNFWFIIKFLHNAGLVKSINYMGSNAVKQAMKQYMWKEFEKNEKRQERQKVRTVITICGEIKKSPILPSQY